MPRHLSNGFCMNLLWLSRGITTCQDCNVIQNDSIHHMVKDTLFLALLRISRTLLTFFWQGIIRNTSGSCRSRRLDFWKQDSKTLKHHLVDLSFPDLTPVIGVTADTRSVPVWVTSTPSTSTSAPLTTSLSRCKEVLTAGAADLHWSSSRLWEDEFRSNVSLMEWPISKSWTPKHQSSANKKQWRTEDDKATRFEVGVYGKRFGFLHTAQQLTLLNASYTLNIMQFWYILILYCLILYTEFPPKRYINMINIKILYMINI